MALPHLSVQNYGKLRSSTARVDVSLSSEAINIAILEMSEDGTLNGLKTKWWYEKSECHSDTMKVR